MSQKFHNLICHVIDGTASREEFELLQDAMQRDPEVLAEYHAAVNLSVSLTEIAQFEDPEFPSLDTGKRALVSAANSNAAAQTGTRHVHVKWILASTIALFGLTVGALFYLNADRQPPPLVDSGIPQRRAAHDDSVSLEDPLYVAQFIRITADVVWSQDSASPDFLLRARKGDSYSIEQGMVEIEYFNGARLILKGPSVFVVTGASTGRLVKGQVTGNVVGGNFLLTTPSATVLDLGTEFGVSVNDSGGTEVCVFDGEVEVGSGTSSGQVGVSLLAGMAARVDRGGNIGRVKDLNTTRYLRSFPETFAQSDDVISLVDIFSATSLRRFRLAGVIAPDTGENDQQPWLRPDGPGNRRSAGFQKTLWQPFVDGVFIPSEKGIGVQVDSAGHQIKLPPCSGRSWGPLWSRRRIDGSASINIDQDFWGTETLEYVVERLKSCETGMIGIHANAGITFDLNAVRELGRDPVQFDTVICNLDNSDAKMAHNQEWLRSHNFSADMRIFVDGELRASRLNFTRADGDEKLSVQLSQGDRFLTLVSSDFDGFDGFDHMVLIDPVLKLEAPGVEDPGSK